MNTRIHNQTMLVEVPEGAEEFYIYKQPEFTQLVYEVNGTEDFEFLPKGYHYFDPTKGTEMGEEQWSEVVSSKIVLSDEEGNWNEKLSWTESGYSLLESLGFVPENTIMIKIEKI